MNIGILVSVARQTEAMSTAHWETEGVWYLGINISLDLSKIMTDNFIAITNAVKTQLDHWSKFQIWFGRIAVIKMMVFPKFLFLFQNFIMQIPQAQLAKIQRTINVFT